jgi:aldose 1-epimerase
MHNGAMSPPITLTGGGLRCEIKPELGGCIAGLWLGDIPVLQSTPASDLRSVRLAGCYPLVPFSNRVGHATLNWQGTSHPLVQNNEPELHALHGTGWQRPWQVLDQNDQLLMLACEHRPDASWPFAFDASQTLRINGNTLELTLSMTNQSATPAPAGIGWHPYFAKRPGSHIHFEAAGRWEMSDEKLPTHREPSRGLDTACTPLDVDHCFDGWGGLVELRDELLHTRITSSLSRLVVFTNSTRDFVAIEPVSHVNNAINLLQAGAGQADALGVRVLAPGESMSAHMGIQVELAQ